MRWLVLIVFSTGCFYSHHVTDDCADDFAPSLELRNPANGECVAVGGGGECGRCGPCPAADIGQALPDWGQCFTQCDSLDEHGCAATAGCRIAYTDFPTTGDRAPEFRGCWSTGGGSGPIHGACTGLDADQCSHHDDCSAHYVDTVANGVRTTKFATCSTEVAGSTCAATTCQVGTTCVEVCDPPKGGAPPVCHAECRTPIACEAEATETACKAHASCVPVYAGDDCTCTPSGCTCKVLTYEHCESP